jgi:hypothetical protein
MNDQHKCDHCGEPGNFCSVLTGDGWKLLCPICESKERAWRKNSSSNKSQTWRSERRPGQMHFAAAIAVMLFLSSCGPFIDTKHGIVSAGFLSATQGFSGKMKTADGATVAWSVVGHDSTSVANNALGTISTVSAGNNLLKGLQSNNALKATQNTNATNVQINAANNAAATAKATTQAGVLNANPQAIAPAATVLNAP